jgi:hypothetical protein
MYSRPDQLGTVDTDTGPLSDNLRGEDQVLQDLLVNGGQGPRSGSLLGRLGALLRLGEDSSLGDEDDVSVRELLLELSGEPVVFCTVERSE